MLGDNPVHFRRFLVFAKVIIYVLCICAHNIGKLAEHLTGK